MKITKPIIIFPLTFFISALFSLVANAATTPSTAKIIGTMTHGGVVTIMGSDFGDKSPVAPVVMG